MFGYSILNEGVQFNKGGKVAIFKRIAQNCLRINFFAFISGASLIAQGASLSEVVRTKAGETIDYENLPILKHYDFFSQGWKILLVGYKR